MKSADYLLEKVARLYNTRPTGLPALQTPDAYGLQGFEAVQVPWGQGEQLHLWQRLVGADKPTYVVFHGVNGHWGAVMTQDARGLPAALDFRTEWLKAFPADANLIAVSMPGFGHSTGTPSRASFDAANAALARYVLHDLQLNPRTMVAAGESLGANHALNFAATAHESGTAIAQVTAVAPFTTMAMAAADVVDMKGWMALPRRRAMANALFGNSSHQHDNAKEIDRLAGAPTRLLIVTAGRDDVCKPWHQRVLFARAMAAGLEVAMHPQDEAGHKEWDGKAVTKASEQLRTIADEGDALAAVWQTGMEALPVPPLPPGSGRPVALSTVRV